MKVTILMPAYNEEHTIRKSIEETVSLLKSVTDFEIIVIDDGSTDNTSKEAVKASCNPHVKVVGYKKNEGKGNALRFGFNYATGAIIIFMDSDSEIKPVKIKNFISALANADIAIGSKRHKESRVKTPWIRKFLSYALNSIVQLPTGIRVSDTQSGFKASRRDALAKLFPLIAVKRYAFDIELLTLAFMLRMRIIELPVDIELSTKFSIKDAFRMLIDIAGITYRLRIIRWYQKRLNGLDTTYKPMIRW